MKSLFAIALALLLGACSLLSPREEEQPVVREQFNPCPFMVDGVNHPNCPKSGSAKGGICLPSGEHHSVPEKCDKVK
jgi:hypothetical protein